MAATNASKEPHVACETVTAEQLLKVLAANTQPVPVRSLADSLKCDVSSINSLLYKLKAAGKVLSSAPAAGSKAPLWSYNKEAFETLDKVIKYLADHKEGVATEKLARELSITKTQANKILYDLERQKLAKVVKDAQGKNPVWLAI
jgi:DNA-binding IclR family transcriptional regulator